MVERFVGLDVYQGSTSVCILDGHSATSDSRYLAHRTFHARPGSATDLRTGPGVDRQRNR
jgi:hypothetical protein